MVSADPVGSAWQDVAREHPAFMERTGEYLAKMSSLACACRVKLNAAFLTVGDTRPSGASPVAVGSVWLCGSDVCRRHVTGRAVDEADGRVPRVTRRL